MACDPSPQLEIRDLLQAEPYRWIQGEIQPLAINVYEDDGQGDILQEDPPSFTVTDAAIQVFIETDLVVPVLDDTAVITPILNGFQVSYNIDTGPLAIGRYMAIMSWKRDGVFVRKPPLYFNVVALGFPFET